MKKKPKKNPSDVNLLARAVVESAIKESITPLKPIKNKKKKKS
ncbi:MAG: hypothetical protein ACHQYP_01325 [Nitrospiria bacterium]